MRIDLQPGVAAEHADQRIAADQASARLPQALQHLAFGGGQRHCLPVRREQAPAIVLQLPFLAGRRARPQHAPGHAEQGRGEDLDLHRLDQVRIRALHQPAHQIRLLAAAAEDDDAHAGVAFLQLLGQGEAVAVGQADVEHDQVETVRLQRRPQRLRGAQRRGLEAVPHQARQQHAVAQHIVVLQQRHPQRGVGGSSNERGRDGIGNAAHEAESAKGRHSSRSSVRRRGRRDR